MAYKRWTSAVHELDIPELPEEIIVNVVQHLPVKRRLTCCALVSQAWASATASTAVTINDDAIPILRCGQLQSWLQQSGNQVVTLQLRHPDPEYLLPAVRPALQLPCTKLTRLYTLSLTNIDVQLHADTEAVSTRDMASGASGCGTCPDAGAHLNSSAVLAAGPMLPQLQHLYLSACSLPLQIFLHLSQLTQLTYLHAVEVCVSASATAPAQTANVRQLSTAIRCILQQLSSLEHLTLMGFEGYNPSTYSSAEAVAALQPISTMQRLQCLELDTGACPDVLQLLPVLPASLRGLHTSEMPFKWQSTGHLTNLLDLAASDNVFDPAALGDLPQLQSLCLDNVSISVHGISLQPGTSTQPLRGTPWLLHNISRLTALQHLELTDLALDQHRPVQQLSALTAPGELRTLKVVDGSGEGAPLPPQALAHMFPAGKQMPNMQELHLEADLFAGAQNDTYIVCVSAEDIQRICNACPSLQRLSLVNVVAADVLGSLRGLPQSLQDLELAGSALGDAAVSALTHLTGLKELMWFSRTLTSAGLRQLGVLRGLTRLMFANNEHIPAFDHHRCPILDFSQAYGVMECDLQTTMEAPQPDVWKQLQDAFMEEDARQELLAKHP